MIHLILATIPRRRANVEALLTDIANQSVVPDRIHLCLDGYAVDDQPRPTIEMPARTTVYRARPPLGPGGRWRVLADIPPEAVVVVLDDDQRLLGDGVIDRIAATQRDYGGAVALMGTNDRGFGGAFARGTHFIGMGAAAMAVRVGDLVGLDDTVEEIRTKGGFDPFGDAGDDEAVVSAHLWRRGVTMRATGPLAITTAFGTQVGSQTERRHAARGARSIHWQREAIHRITGWPWICVDVTR